MASAKPFEWHRRQNPGPFKLHWLDHLSGIIQNPEANVAELRRQFKWHPTILMASSPDHLNYIIRIWPAHNSGTLPFENGPLAVPNGSVGKLL